MTMLIDDLSRILAAPMAPSDKLRLIRSRVVAMGNSRLERTRAPAIDDRWALKATKRRTQLDVAETAARLRMAYLARNSFVYRMEIFWAFLMLRHADGAELERVLEELLKDISEHGADGIETLVLATADGVAMRGDAETKRRVQASLASMAGNLKFWSTVTPPNMRIPLGRVSSYLVLDVRPDATRELLDQLVRMSQASQELQSMLELLDSDQTRDAMCDLPALPNQTGDISAVDAARLENCAEDGSSGSSEDSPVERALGRLLLGGCNLTTNDEVATMVARIGAMDDCFEQRNGGQPLPTAGLGLGKVKDVAKGAGAGGDISKDVIAELIAWFIGEEVTGTREERQAYEAQKEVAAQAVRDGDSAREYRQEIEGRLNGAKDMLETSKAQLRDAREAVRTATTDPEREAALRSEREAQAEVDRWQNRVDKLDDELVKARNEEEKGWKKAGEELVKAERMKPGADLDPEDPFNSEACREAMGDPSDRVISQRLGEDWTAWNVAKGRLPHVWDPAPDDLQPYDTLRLPFCGSDEATLSNLPEKCSMPVDCLEGTPDENCECNGAPTDDARLVANITANACRDVRCPEGTTGSVSQGLVCVCAEQPFEEGHQQPPRPTPTVIAALFEKVGVTAPDEKFTTFGLVRSLFQDLSGSRDRR